MKNTRFRKQYHWQLSEIIRLVIKKTKQNFFLRVPVKRTGQLNIMKNRCGDLYVEISDWRANMQIGFIYQGDIKTVKDK